MTTEQSIQPESQPERAADWVERAVEALLMVAERPLPPVELAQALEAPLPAVRDAIDRLRADYDGEAGGPRRGFELREVGGGWRIFARADFDDQVAAFIGAITPSKLSQAALETLAVIAYKQPVTRSQVAAIRAVNVDSVVRTLLARGLVEEAFVDPDTQAIHYRTTDLLLEQLGINDISELPPIAPLLPDDVDEAE